MAAALMASGIEQAVVTLRGPLEDLGFRKRAGEIFTIDLASDVLGWLGLNMATRHQRAGEVEINPVVGVRHQAVERLVVDLRGLTFHPYVPPTVSTPIGHVMPSRRYESWIIRDGDEIQGASLVAVVAEYGVDFMRSLANLERVSVALKQRLGHEPEYQLPVVLALLGHVNEATDELERAAGALGDRQDEAAEEYRRFAEAVRDRLLRPARR